MKIVLLRLLAKHWFLLTLLTGVAFAWLAPDWLRWTEHVHPSMVVAAALFLSAFSLKSRSLYETLLRPWAALWAVLFSYGFIPGAACLIGPLLPLEDYRIGLLIAASVPCTLASAMLWTRLAQGNEATALLTTVLSTGSSWLFTTAWLTFGTGASVEVDSLKMMQGLFLVLVLPFAAGQGLRASARLARFSEDYKHALGVLARLLILLVIFKAALSVKLRLDEQAETFSTLSLLAAGFCAVGLHVAGLFAAFASGKLVRIGRVERVAVAFSASQKTLPVSLLLFDDYFTAYPLAIVPIVFYHVGQLIVDTFIAEAIAGRREDDMPQPEEAIV